MLTLLLQDGAYDGLADAMVGLLVHGQSPWANEQSFEYFENQLEWAFYESCDSALSVSRQIYQWLAQDLALFASALFLCF